MDAFFQSRGSNYAGVKNFHSISTPVQHHLWKVYSTVASLLLVSSVGVYLHMILSIGGFLTSIAFIGLSVWLMGTPSTAASEGQRYKLLIAAALCEGASIGPLISNVVNVDPSIIVTAFLSTLAVFACFSGAALLAKRREFLFLGGILASAVTAMLSLQFFSMLFGGATAMYSLELYGGLLLTIGYILFDTQLIIERAERGDMDYIKHSLDLFVDFAALFVRIAVILTGKEKERKEKRRERKV